MSSTRRAIGPTVFHSRSSPGTWGTLPSVGIRSPVGFKPTTPQNADGIRMLPPKSVPKPRGDPPEAISAASPPELPPAEWERFQGFRVKPKIRLVVSGDALISGQFVLP